MISVVYVLGSCVRGGFVYCYLALVVVILKWWLVVVLVWVCS